MAVTLSHADMEYFGNVSQLQFVNDLVQRIVGEGSLRIDKLSVIPVNMVGNFQPKITSAPTQGLPSARLTMLVRGVTVGDAGQGVGLLCMMSQRNVTSAGRAYYLQYRSLNQTLELGQIVSGLNVAGTLFSSVAVPSVSAALQLSWDLASNSSQITLRGYIGSQHDFSDLVQVISHVDTTPLTATVTEGGFYSDNGGGNDVSILVDNMELLPLES